MEDFHQKATKEQLRQASDFSDSILKTLAELDNFDLFLIAEAMAFKAIENNFGSECAAIYLDSKKMGMDHFAWLANAADECRDKLTSMAGEPPLPLMRAINNGLASTLNDILEDMHKTMKFDFSQLTHPGGK